MRIFDAAKFAKWLETAFQKSRYKSYSELAKAAKVERSTVSALVTAKPQSSTGRPSQPKDTTVIALAEALGEDVNQALLAAGHAPREQNKPKNFLELIAALENIGIEIPGWAKHTNFDDYTEDDFEELKQRIALDTDITIRRKKK